MSEEEKKFISELLRLIKAFEDQTECNYFKVLSNMVEDNIPDSYLGLYK
tara:strand:+ start:328 stop:474 length:147 start_codon:yes stop_codon:yes gene_type:complete